MGNPAPAKPSFAHTFLRGLWSENPGLCQLLGLCPLLAVTNSAVNALGLGLATLAVLTMSSLLISVLHRLIWREIRIPIYVALIASLVTCVSFMVEAYYPRLHESLGIYLSLIVTNCIIMGRAEACAGKSDPLRATLDALGCGIGFGLVLLATGAIRELLGTGTVFAGGEELLGDLAAQVSTTLFAPDQGITAAILPPGGFIVLALLVALKNALDLHRRHRRENRLRIRSRRV
ncbi:MAG: electron transport complex subunit E [Succinivibrionaceae bacterium]|nr:electron transport complex subunit E [Succinivibrionaceae bacterium]